MGIVNTIKKVGETAVRVIRFTLGRLPDKYQEPARRIGAWLSKATAGVTVAYEALVEFTDIVPESWRTKSQLAAVIAAAVILVLNDVQAELTRDRVTPTV